MSLSLPVECVDILTNAEGKALATQHVDDGVHVVPVSVLYVHEDHLTLVNFFMGQTLKNIEADSAVSLAVWRGLSGYQIKATATHYTDGALFDEVVTTIADTMPERTVQGVLTLEPHTIFDISADRERAGALVRSA
jgi:predicted pyridoxine 5'-phosphate oxidase superfamily flavin-nucleotide-binding protein